MAPPDIDPKILLALGLGSLQGCDLINPKVGPCLDFPVDSGTSPENTNTSTDSAYVGPCLDFPVETGETGVGPCLDYRVETGETGLGPCLDYYYPPDSATEDSGYPDTATEEMSRQSSGKVHIPTSNSDKLRQAIREKLIKKGILPSSIDSHLDKE